MFTYRALSQERVDRLKLVMKRYLQGFMFREIGVEIGVCGGRAQQLLHQAIRYYSSPFTCEPHLDTRPLKLGKREWFCNFLEGECYDTHIEERARRKRGEGPHALTK